MKRFCDRSDHRHSRPGFTLIELLVVIAIISVLVAMLLPALAKSREHMKDVRCNTNQRTIFQGVMMYAQANQDVLPAGWIDNPDPNLNNWVPYVWQYIYPDHPWKSGDATFWDRFTTGVFLCPLKPVNHSLSNGFISYGFNSHMSCKPLSKIEDASQKFLLADGGADLEDVYPGGVCFYFRPESGRIYSITYRHRYNSLVVCADGHVTRTRLGDIWTIREAYLLANDQEKLY
jgi:prepilin-type N-terminal cleavage/methylation domain-containing protein